MQSLVRLQFTFRHAGIQNSSMPFLLETAHESNMEAFFIEVKLSLNPVNMRTSYM